jgi:hypothetical protein
VSALVKPGYSPYEQYATTTSSQGPWTDIYALGATLYHAITGKRPPDAPSRILSDEYVAAGEAALSSYRSGFLAAIDKALKLEVGERPQSIAEWRGDLLAPEPKRAPGRLGLRLPIARTLGRLSSVVAPVAPVQAAVLAEATVALTEQPQSLVPVPPDAPQPKGQLLDFIDALKKHRPTILTPKKRNQSAAKPAREPVTTPSREPAVAQPDSDAQFGLGYGPPPEPAPAIARALPKKIAPPPPRRAPRVLQRAAAKRRAPPRPRRVWRMPSRRWRSVIFKVAIAVTIASLAVAYQETAPRRQARGAGMVASQTADLAQTVQLIGHKGPVLAAASSDEGRWIVSAGTDATIRVWNAGSGALVRTIEVDEGAPTALAVGNRRALAGHKGGTIVLWDLEKAEKLGAFQLGSTAAVTSLAFTAETNEFVAASQDGSVALFDTRLPSAPSMLLNGRDGTGMIVTASLARGFVASAGADRTVRLWRAETESLTRTYRIPAGEIAALDISSDGRYLAAAVTDGSIRVWSNSSSRAIRTFKAHQARVGAIAFGPDRLLATASDDGKVKVWNLRVARVVRILSGGAGPLRALSFTPDGRRVIGAGQDGVIRVWSLDLAPANGI